MLGGLFNDAREQLPAAWAQRHINLLYQIDAKALPLPSCAPRVS